jgi:hypothetical protein
MEHLVSDSVKPSINPVFLMLILLGISTARAEIVNIREEEPLGKHFGDTLLYELAPYEENRHPLRPWVLDLGNDGKQELIYSGIPHGVNIHCEPDTDREPLYILARNEDGLMDNIAPLQIDGPVPVFNGLIFDAYHEDFNGDGLEDIYIPVNGSECPSNHDLTSGGQNYLLLQKEDGMYLDVTETHLPQHAGWTHGSAIGDFDLDGDIDIFDNGFACGAQDDTGLCDIKFAVLMFNDGTGKFTVVGDFSGKQPGDPTALPGYEPITGANGHFPEEEVYLGPWPIEIDVEGDGDLDLALGYSFIVETCPTYPDCDAHSFARVLLINDGKGHFSRAPQEPWQSPINSEQTFVQHNLTYDLNHDGLDDLLLHDWVLGEDKDGVIDENNILQILISNGDGTFRDETFERYPQEPRDLSHFQFHDLDGDGHMDLFSHVSTEPRHEDVRINDGEGYFRRIDNWTNQYFGGRVLDVDGDGGTDYVDVRNWGIRLAKMTLPYGAELDGTEGQDWLIGGAWDNVYRGFGGDDVLDGGLGDDNMDGGDGDDELIGGKGNDRLVTGSGTDSVDGGPGRDRLVYPFSMQDAEFMLGAINHISRDNDSDDEITNTEYALFPDGVTPLPTAAPSAIGSLNGIAGLWYDPSLDGEGFNIITTPSGTVVFFYGYAADGQRLWLVSETLAEDFDFEQVLDLIMYEGEGGTFDEPAPSAQALSEWGRLKGLFDACGAGRLALHGADGVKTTYQIKLAGITDADCQTENLAAPSGIAGLWYDAELDGEGYNVIITDSSTVVFFYGYDRNGERLWLVSETLSGAPQVGETVVFTMYAASGGTFDEPRPSTDALAEWGMLEVTANTCTEAVANLSGVDGEKTSKLVQLAGIDHSSCPDFQASSVSSKHEL